MVKKIVLKLKSIKYSGNSIGDDVRLDVSILDISFSIKKKIKTATKQEFDKIIGEFNTDRKIFEADINIRVVEEDPIFNDVGNLETEIQINTTKKIQEFTYEVIVKEFRVNVSKAKAVFKIILQAEILEMETYIPEMSDGWLKVKIDDIKEDQSLPAFLKVSLTHSDNKRDYFKILEGLHKGRSASVAKKSEHTSYLQFGFIERSSNVHGVYSISKKIFTLNDKKYVAVDYPAIPWTKVLYDIEIPDTAHEGGIGYPEAGKAKVWFRIGHDGARYLHAGSRSAGCMTIKETKRWLEIYNILIKARRGDDISVGILTVIE